MDRCLGGGALYGGGHLPATWRGAWGEGHCTVVVIYLQHGQVLGGGALHGGGHLPARWACAWKTHLPVTWVGACRGSLSFNMDRVLGRDTSL